MALSLSCGQNESDQSTDVTTPSGENVTIKAPDTGNASQTAGSVAADAQADAQKAAQDAQAAATKAANEAKAKAQGLIDQAKNLVSQNKFEEALKLLQNLTGVELSSEQQAQTDQIKKSIQEAAAKKAANDAAAEAKKSLGNLLPGNK